MFTPILHGKSKPEILDTAGSSPGSAPPPGKARLHGHSPPPSYFHSLPGFPGPPVGHPAARQPPADQPSWLSASPNHPWSTQLLHPPRLQMWSGSAAASSSKTPRHLLQLPSSASGSSYVPSGFQIWVRTISSIVFSSNTVKDCTFIELMVFDKILKHCHLPLLKEAKDLLSWSTTVISILCGEALRHHLYLDSQPTFPSSICRSSPYLMPMVFLQLNKPRKKEMDNAKAQYLVGMAKWRSDRVMISTSSHTSLVSYHKMTRLSKWFTECTGARQTYLLQRHGDTADATVRPTTINSTSIGLSSRPCI